MINKTLLIPHSVDVFRRYRSGGTTYQEWLNPYNANPDLLLDHAFEVLAGHRPIKYHAVIAPPPASITWEGVTEKPTLNNYKPLTKGRPVLLIKPDVYLAQKYTLAQLKSEIGKTFEDLPSVLGVDRQSTVLHPYRSDIRKTAIRLANIRSNEKSTQFIKSDISKFYPSIRLQTLKNKLKELNVSDQTITQCFNFFEREIECPDYFTVDDIKQCNQFKNGVPLGLVISPYLANLYIYDIDLEFASANYVRYVDDLVFWGTTRYEVDQLWSSYRQRLDEIGLNVHPMDSKKTYHVSPKKPLHFLGLSVSSHGRAHPLAEKLLLFQHKLATNCDADQSVLKSLNTIDNLCTGFVGYYGKLLTDSEVNRLDRYVAGKVRSLVKRAGLQVRDKSLSDLMGSLGIKSLRMRIDAGDSYAKFASDAYSSEEIDDLISSIMSDDV